MSVDKRLWMTKVFMATSPSYQHRFFFWGGGGRGAGRYLVQAKLFSLFPFLYPFLLLRRLWRVGS